MQAPFTTSAAVVLLAAVLTNNIVLTRFLGMCSFVGLSRDFRTAFGMGVAVTFVTTVTSVLNYGVYYGILVEEAPLCAADLAYLAFPAFIMVIAAFVHLVDMVVERCFPVLHCNFGVYLPLITVNCAILGVTLFMIDSRLRLGLPFAALYGFGSGLGWLLAICLMAGIHRRLQHADIPKPLRGLGITLIVAGLMAIAFLGFGGAFPL